MRATRISLLLMASLTCLSAFASTARPVVIAHRGASGYLPEHTLESAAYAHALGVDYIEQDVVLSKDHVVVVLHDIHVDTTTDVAARFPTRHRADGRYYAIDFTWEELRSLKVNERRDAATGQQVFPQRFPSTNGDGTAFRLCTFDEQLALIAGLNRSTGRDVGVYPEIKAPAWHRSEGADLSSATLAILRRRGYATSGDRAIVQCFDPAELKRLRHELGCELRLTQLIEENDDHPVADYVAMRTPDGLREVARYAQAIGPSLSQVIDMTAAANGKIATTALTRDARAAGLAIHPYTFRNESLPPRIADLSAFIRQFLAADALDGLFIDHPDVAVRVLNERDW